MPTAAHVIYIPFMLLLGIVIGYILGGRAARDAIASDKVRRETREARRKAREAANPPESSPPA